MLELEHIKGLLRPYRMAQTNFDLKNVTEILGNIAPKAQFKMCHPFGDFGSANDFVNAVYAPLNHAIEGLERRDMIVIAGHDEDGEAWVGCAGHYVGTFKNDWLGIPPTGHFCHMRFHEFYRFKEDRVVEVQAIWDIPELMIQAKAWPLAPSLGRNTITFGPASQDGLALEVDPEQGRINCDLVIDMLDHLCKHPAQGGPEVMELDRFWDQRMSWYGPSGIGMCRGIEGFRNWHQIPFLNAMPDRTKSPVGTKHHFFGDRSYVAVTGWPNMKQTLTHAGWLGLPPMDKVITLRSLDFWRIESGLIRENWVLVDLLDVYAQLGIDVFARLQEFNKVRG